MKYDIKTIGGKRYVHFSTEAEEKRFLYANLISVFLIIFMLFALYFMASYLYREKDMLKTNPFIYIAKVSDEGTGGYLSCSCIQTSKLGLIYPFDFNRTGVYPIIVNDYPFVYNFSLDI